MLSSKNQRNIKQGQQSHISLMGENQEEEKTDGKRAAFSQSSLLAVDLSVRKSQS